jgi:hypothetical protein
MYSQEIKLAEGYTYSSRREVLAWKYIWLQACVPCNII